MEGRVCAVLTDVYPGIVHVLLLSRALPEMKAKKELVGLHVHMKSCDEAPNSIVVQGGCFSSGHMAKTAGGYRYSSIGEALYELMAAVEVKVTPVLRRDETKWQKEVEQTGIADARRG